MRAAEWSRQGRVERCTLPSGLRLVVYRDPGLPVVALRCYVAGGSMAETPPGDGAAHLLEHLLGGHAAEALLRNGVLANALTGRDLTAYRWQALAVDALPSLKSFLDVIAAPLPAARLEAERRVVLDEVRLAAGRPLAVLQQRVVETLFPDHPFRHPVGGEPRAVAALAMADLEAYRRRQYAAAETVLVAVGDVQGESLAAAAARPLPGDGVGALRRHGATGAPSDGAARPASLPPPPVAGLRRQRVTVAAGDDEWTVVGYATAGEGAEGEEAALEELAHRLASRLPGGLAHQLLAEEGVRQARVGLSGTPYGAGWLRVVVRHRAGFGEAVAQRVAEHLDGVARGTLPLPPPASTAELPVTRLDACCELLGEGELRHGDPLHHLAVAARRGQLREEELAACARRHLVAERAATAHVAAPGESAGRTLRAKPAPLAGPVAPGPAAPAVLPEGPTAPAAPVPGAVSGVPGLPRPGSRVLANGLSLLVLPTNQPLAACQVLFRGGVLADDDDTSGVCSLLARTLPQDPPEPLRRRLVEHRRATGDDVFAFCDASFYGLSASAPVDRLASLAALLADLAYRPRLSEVAIAREAEQTAVWLEGRRPAWDASVHARLRRLLHPRSPYRRDEIGRPETLRRLGLAQVESCRRTTWAGGNAAVVVSGAVAVEATLDHLEEVFSTAPPGPALAGPPPSLPTSRCREEVAGELLHAAVAVGFPGLPWEAAEQPAVQMVKSLLVGPRNDAVGGRLFAAIRSQGVAYALQVVEQAGLGDGHLAVLVACAPESLTAVETLVEEELARLRRGGLEEGELTTCRKMALLDHLLLAEEPRLHAYTAGRHVLFAGRPAAWEEVPDALAGVGVEDVIRVARRHLDPAVMATAALLPPAGGAAAVRQGGPP